MSYEIQLARKKFFYNPLTGVAKIRFRVFDNDTSAYVIEGIGVTSNATHPVSFEKQDSLNEFDAITNAEGGFPGEFTHADGENAFVCKISLAQDQLAQFEDGSNRKICSVSLNEIQGVFRISVGAAHSEEFTLVADSCTPDDFSSNKIDAWDDTINYNGSLVLSNAPTDNSHFYAVSLRKAEETQSVGISSIQQCVADTDSDAYSYSDLTCEVVPADSSVPKCGKYVVDFVKRGDSLYSVLYEGTDNGIEYLDYYYLHRDSSENPWFEDAINTQSQVKHDPSSFCWKITSNGNAVGTVSDFPRIYTSSETSESNFDSSGKYLRQFGDVFATRFECFDASGENTFSSVFGTIKSRLGENTPYLWKGKMLAAVLCASSSEKYTAIFDNLFTIVLSGFPKDGSGDINMESLKVAEFQVLDGRYRPIFEDGGKFVVFGQQSNAIVNYSGSSLLNEYFGGIVESKHYINGNFLATAFAVFNNGGYNENLVSFPCEKEIRISCFPGKLTVKTSKDDEQNPASLATYYARGLAMSALVNFQIQHTYGENEEVELVTGEHSLMISKMLFTSNPDHITLNENGSIELVEEEGEYYGSAIEGGVSMGEATTSSKFGAIEYYDQQNGWYRMAIPFGGESDTRDRLVIPSSSTLSSYAGTYALMTYSEAKEKNARVPSSEDSYSGFQRIFKHTSSEYYVRAIDGISSSVDEGYYWVLSSSISDNEENNILARSVNANVDSPAEALGNYIITGTTGSADISYYESLEGNGESRQVSFALADSFGNATVPRMVGLEVRNSKPQGIFFSLEGSSGNSSYTGFYVSDGRFFPTDRVKAKISARSDDGIGLEWRLTGRIPKTTEWKPLVSGTVIDLSIRLNPAGMSRGIMDLATDVPVTLEVRDEAGNTASSTAKIFFCTRLFRTQNQHLIEESPSYSHQVYKKEGDIASLVYSRQYSNTEYTRSWNEVWYPESHGMPIDETTGLIDEEEAKRLSRPIDSTGKNGPTPAELANYDQLMLDEDGELVTDNEGRYVQNISAWSSGKTYPGMENRDMVTVSDGTASNTQYDGFYRIIDNTGNSEFKLEFEIFDFSLKVTSNPANLQAPYDGDMLAFYDASDESCCKAVSDKYGNVTWVLTDASKLTFLFAVKGSKYSNDSEQKFRKLGDTVSGDLEITDNGFITPSLAEYQRICLVPFTDYGDTGDSVGSGFKLKAGPKHYKLYQNYDCANDTGEFWIHTFNSIGNWSAPANAEATYRYYGSYANILQEEGQIQFSKRQKNTVLGTFNCYLYLEAGANGAKKTPYGYFSPFADYLKESSSSDNAEQHALRTFAMTEDDLVDYIDPSFYVVPTGTVPNTQDRYDFDNESASQGKFSNGYSITKDVGIISFLPAYKVPKGRIMGSYTHHTYYRLTADGYGDLYFYDSMLVPATPDSSHTDWTYVDLKIVNEGTNTLNSGTLQFLARGYITKGSVVDVVLDQNRPWDVQEGTTAETVQRTGAICKGTYAELSSELSREKAFAARAKQTCALGTLEPKQTKYIRVFWYIASDADGTQWIDCTRGRKTYSAELSGMYFTKNA